jgi:hypothetical protein
VYEYRFEAVVLHAGVDRCRYSIVAFDLGDPEAPDMDEQIHGSSLFMKCGMSG